MNNTSTETIKPGDLVQVVRWPCCGALLGHIFTVGYLDTLWGKGWICCRCKRDVLVGTWAVSADNPPDLGGHISWLKRIPPLSELESEKRDEEITA